MSPKNKPNEIYITRIYDAPLKMVWDAWTDPKQKAKWWGPRGFTITTHKSDVRTGGTWDYTMHGPDGVDYPNVTKYLEVEKYSRMIYDHGGTHDKPALFRVTVQFTENKGKTLMEMIMALPTAEAAAETKKFIKKANGNSTWDRLAEHVAEEKGDPDKFVINRTFDAPLELMFEMFTNPEHMAMWSGPTGSTIKNIKSDIRSGGKTFYVMTSADGTKMYGKAQYEEVIKPHRIVYVQYFCNENEAITRHPMAPTWPEAMRTTILLESEGPSRTRVNLTWEVDGKATDVERETFNKAKAGMAQGWGGSFDKLEDYLKDIKSDS